MGRIMTQQETIHEPRAKPPTIPTAVEVLREVLDHFRAAEHLPDDLYATALLVAYGGAS